MQFVHLTDPHVDIEGKHYGVDAAWRFAQAIKHIGRYCPQTAFIAITGDLAHRADEASYWFIRQTLTQAPCPTFLIPGNHDDPQTMLRVFRRFESVRLEEVDASAGGVWTDVLQTRYAEAVFLDTHVVGSDCGVVSSRDLALVKRALNTPAEQSLLLFMHHPPFKSGIAAMDVVGLSNASELSEIVRRGSVMPAGIFCGHLHRSISGIWEGVPCWCRRSSAHQVDLSSSQGKTIGYCAESPEYGIVTYERSLCGQDLIFSQSVAFADVESFSSTGSEPVSIPQP